MPCQIALSEVILLDGCVLDFRLNGLDFDLDILADYAERIFRCILGSESVSCDNFELDCLLFGNVKREFVAVSTFERSGNLLRVRIQASP